MESYPKRFFISLFFFIAFLTFALGGTVEAGPAAQTVRPKIGLALGGGSAKGLAHIGVLLWLEENHIPIDYIAGASMGGLMAGCYAMGMSPREIRQFVEGVSWKDLFETAPAYEVLDFRRKEDRRDYPIEAQLGLDIEGKKLKFPTGLSVHQVGLILSRLTLPYSMVRNFDELPTPFRCVATDIQDAGQVVMEDGSLAEAMRATMAIPGVFTPVKRNGHYLVDGGVLNNLPADVAKTMGADVVIAVDVNATVKDRDVQGINQILMRSISTVIIDNSRRSAALADVLIAPNLQGLTSMDWREAERFIKLGYEAAANQAELLKKYTVDAATWEEYLQKRHERRKVTIPEPAAVEVTGTNQLSAGYIRECLRGFIGKPLDIDALEWELTDLMGSGLYEGLRYQFQLTADTPALLITAVEKPYGPPFVDLAFLLEADGVKADRVAINARSRITWLNLWGSRSELRVDLGFGTELDWQAELFLPLNARSRWFFAPALYLEQENESIYKDEERICDFKNSTGGGKLDLGYTIGKFSEARLGYAIEYQDTRNKVGEPVVTDADDGLIKRVHFDWVYNNSSNAMIPRDGLSWSINSNWYLTAPGADDGFGITETSLLWNIPVGGEDSVFFKFECGFTDNESLPLAQQFTLGGPFRLGAYDTGQWRGSNYILSNLGYLKSLGKLPLTEKNIYLGFWVETGAVFEKWSAIEPVNQLSAGLMSPTIFGPMYIGVSFGESESQILYIGVGKIF